MEVAEAIVGMAQGLHHVLARCRGLFAAGLLALPFGAYGDEPPLVEHQPLPCTIPEKPITVCARVTDDGAVGRARVYFRPVDERYYSAVDMVFGGINYCGTLPAPREKKARAIEYYVQAVDDQYQAGRTSTYQMSVLPEGVCEFPPLEKDASRAASIVVYATNKNQGRRLPDAFRSDGVSFVPIGAK